MRHSPRLPQALGLAVLVTLAAVLAGCGYRANVPAAIPVATVASYPGNGEPPLLVDASWLQAQQGSENARLVILDASDLITYRAGHIPGAVHAWWQDTMNPNELFYGGVLKPEENDPDPQLLRRYFIEDLGVTPESQVVIYDNAQNRWAARLVWTLRFLGYPNAAVLDGGLAAWRGIGGELQSGENEAAAVSQPSISPQKGYYVYTDELLQMLNEPELVLLDVRTEAERTDDIDQTIEPGSIPNSIVVPWTATLADSSGRLLPPEQLRALFEQAGVTPDRTVVIYARFGVETAHTWLALKLLGYPTVLIYDGGWVDWAKIQLTPKQSLDSSSNS